MTTAPTPALRPRLRLAGHPSVLWAMLVLALNLQWGYAGLFNLGVYLRKAYPDNWEAELLTHNMQYLDPPLPLSEVNVVAKQLTKKDYAYRCKEPPIAPWAFCWMWLWRMPIAVCRFDLCRRRRLRSKEVPRLTSAASVSRLAQPA